MANITLKGASVHTVGNLPVVGSHAPDFTLAKADLSDSGLSEFKGKKVILNIFPSIETSICSASVRRFNLVANELKNTVVLCISLDLPFDHKRFCGTEGLNNVITLSAFRSPEFGKSYGVTMTDGGFRGLLSRAVIVLDESHKVIYTEQVPEIAQEPDYDKALSALGK
jgi:thiol peroxidase